MTITETLLAAWDYFLYGVDGFLALFVGLLLVFAILLIGRLLNGRRR